MDITEKIPSRNCVKAERAGKNVLILWKLDSPRERLDKKLADYLLEYLWLSKGSDNIFSHVQGNDYILCTTEEVQEGIKEDGSLFEVFDLF